MKTLNLTSLLLLILFLWLGSGCSVRHYPRYLNVFPEERNLFEEIKIVRVVVEQNINGEQLPFYKVAKEALSYAGFQVVKEDARTYDATIRVAAKGRYIGAFYFSGSVTGEGEPIGKHYRPRVGASLKGKISLIVSHKTFNWDFSGKASPPFHISVPKSGSYSSFEGIGSLLEAFRKGYRKAFYKVVAEMKDTTYLISNLKEGEIPVIREAAAWVLGKRGCTCAIEALIGALKDKNVDVRSRAAASLVEMGEPVLEHLIATLQNENLDVRKGASEVLDKIHWEPQTRQQRIAYLFARQEWTALVKIGSPAVELLISTLKDGDEDYGIRREAAEALGDIGQPALEPLIAVLKKGEDWNAREKAADSLGNIGDTAAVKPLIAALQDEESLVRDSAADALGQLGDIRAVKPLSAVLKDDKVSYVRKEAASALGNIGDEEAIGPLTFALRDEDEDWDVRAEAVDALGLIGKPAVGPLVAVLKDDELSGLRDEAAEALGMTGDTHALKALIGALRDEDSKVRRAVVFALGQLGDIRAVQPLTTMLKDEDGWVRREAAEALMKIGEPGVEALIAALRDEDSAVRMTVRNELNRMFGQYSFGQDQAKWEKWWNENKDEILKSR